MKLWKIFHAINYKCDFNQDIYYNVPTSSSVVYHWSCPLVGYASRTDFHIYIFIDNNIQFIILRTRYWCWLAGYNIILFPTLMIMMKKWMPLIQCHGMQSIEHRTLNNRAHDTNIHTHAHTLRKVNCEKCIVQTIQRAKVYVALHYIALCNGTISVHLASINAENKSLVYTIAYHSIPVLLSGS